MPGVQLEPSWQRRVWHPATEKAGLTPPPLSFHDLRHTCAAWLIDQGEPVLVVQRRLGHATPTATLSVYGTSFPVWMKVPPTAHRRSLRKSRTIRSLNQRQTELYIMGQYLVTRRFRWWTLTDSNRRPLPCNGLSGVTWTWENLSNQPPPGISSHFCSRRPSLSRVVLWTHVVATEQIGLPALATASRPQVNNREGTL